MRGPAPARARRQRDASQRRGSPTSGPLGARIVGYDREIMALTRVSFGAALALALGLPGCGPSSPPSPPSIPGPAAPAGVEQPSSGTAADLARILRDPDPDVRARELGALLPTLGPDAIPAVKEVFRDPSLDRGSAEYELLIRFWARHDPAEATRWAADWSPLFYRQAAMLVTLPYWVAADLQSSIVAVQNWILYRPDLREAAARGLIIGWYESGQPGLVQYIHDLGAGFDQQTAVATYVRAAVMKEGSDAVMRWAESVPEDDEAYKLAVYRQLASVLPIYDHAAAMRWCEKQCDGPYGQNLRQLIAMRWAARDGPAALEWLSTSPEGHEKNLGLRATFAEWIRQDPEEVLDWMDAQVQNGGPPEWLQPVDPVYAMLLANRRSPADAIAWAQRIPKDLEREVTLIKIARGWREADEAAAEAWLASSPLSEEARAQVRDPKWRKAPSPRAPQAEASPKAAGS